MSDLYDKAKIFHSVYGYKLSLLFICAGNTCRSATAAAIAKDLLGNSANIMSAGLRIRGAVGDPMKHHAQAIMCGSETCYQDQHASKHVTASMISDASHIFVMDRGLLDELYERYSYVLRDNAYLLCDSSVPDPYFSEYEENTKSLSERRGAYYTMNSAVSSCLIQRLNEIFDTMQRKEHSQMATQYERDFYGGMGSDISTIAKTYPLTAGIAAAAYLTDTHPMDIVSIPIKMLPKMEIPHPLDLVQLPLRVLKQVATNLKVPGRSSMKTKQQLAGGIHEHVKKTQRGLDHQIGGGKVDDIAVLLEVVNKTSSGTVSLDETVFNSLSLDKQEALLMEALDKIWIELHDGDEDPGPFHEWLDNQKSNTETSKLLKVLARFEDVVTLLDSDPFGRKKLIDEALTGVWIDLHQYEYPGPFDEWLESEIRK